MSSFSSKLRDIGAKRQYVRAGIYARIVGTRLIWALKREAEFAAAKGKTTLTFKRRYETLDESYAHILSCWMYAVTRLNKPDYGFSSVTLNPATVTSNVTYSVINARYTYTYTVTMGISVEWGF